MSCLMVMYSVNIRIVGSSRRSPLPGGKVSCLWSKAFSSLPPEPVKSKDHREFKPILHNSIKGTRSSEQRKQCWPATVIVFDIETTGFSIPLHRIIEFAARDLMGGKNSTFETLVNPGMIVPNSRIHGISTRMVRRRDVPRFEDVIPVLLQFIESRRIPDKPVLLIAHNGRKFDVPFLVTEFQRCGVHIPEHWRFLDTLPLSRQYRNPDGSKLTSHKQEALMELFEIRLTGPAHRAMRDVTGLSLIVQRLTYHLKLPVEALLDMSFTATETNVTAAAAAAAASEPSGRST